MSSDAAQSSAAPPEEQVAPTKAELTDFRCIVNLDLFRRAWSCVSHEATRYYLNGVHIEPQEGGGALLVATDGHKLICLRDMTAVVEGGARIVRLHKRHQKEALKPKRHFDAIKHGELHLVVAGQRASIAHVQRQRGDTHFIAPFHLATDPNEKVIAHQWAETLIDGNYPEWRKVIGKADAAECAEVTPFNPGMAHIVAKALCNANTGFARVLPMEQSESERNENMRRFFVLGSMDGFGVFMSCRNRDVASALPSWSGIG